MRRHKKIVMWTVFAVLAGAILFYALFPAYLLACVYWISGSVADQQREATIRVLHETDHEILLKAGRQVLKESQAGRWETGRMYKFREDPDPDVSHLPRTIRNLNPSYIVIHHEDFLSIEMMGGLHHLGIRVYPEGFDEPFGGFEYGDKKLAEGLWCYDDGYRECVDYEKTVESLDSKKK
ncbi:MAG: hypothetical protein JW720_05290 [Sedimentisphaerales bacterium]|nr:hypothetical protein [Sedimentisphaerales bacterium]